MSLPCLLPDPFRGVRALLWRWNYLARILPTSYFDTVRLSPLLPHIAAARIDAGLSTQPFRISSARRSGMLVHIFDTATYLLIHPILQQPHTCLGLRPTNLLARLPYPIATIYTSKSSTHPSTCVSMLSYGSLIVVHFFDTVTYLLIHYVP